MSTNKQAGSTICPSLSTTVSAALQQCSTVTEYVEKICRKRKHKENAPASVQTIPAKKLSQQLVEEQCKAQLLLPSSWQHLHNLYTSCSWRKSREEAAARPETEKRQGNTSGGSLLLPASETRKWSCPSQIIYSDKTLPR